MQLSFLENNKDFNLSELRLSNFRLIHGDYVLKLNKGINVVMPNYTIYDDANDYDCGEIDYFAPNADTLYMNDFIKMIDVLRCKRDYDLWDYSFFGSNKNMSITAMVEELGGKREFIRKQQYRGEEVLGEIIGYTKTHRPRVLKMEKSHYEEKIINNFLEDIVIYPRELPVMLRVQYTHNFDYLVEKFPTLDVHKFINDTNAVLQEYSIKCHLEERGKEVYIHNVRSIDLALSEDMQLRETYEKMQDLVDSLTMDILFNTNEKYEDKHLEIAMIIALQKQLNNNVIVFTHGFLQGIYDDDLELALLMMLEFFHNKQQVILLYNNPYDISCMYKIEDVMNNFNKHIGLKLFNKVGFTERHTLNEEWENRTLKIAARELLERQELPYEKKKEVSKRIIKRAILDHVTDFNKMSIGYSYGKDSMATMLLVKESIDELNNTIFENKPIPYPTLVFCNTGVEFPETYAYKKEIDPILKSMGFKIDQTKPLMRFVDIVKKYGFPMFGKAIRKDKNPQIYEKIESLNIKTCGNMCCHLLKEEPTRLYYLNNKIQLSFVGILAEESYMRMSRWYMLGDTYWNKGQNLYKCQPLIHFSEDDVWRCIKESGLAYNPIYDKGYWDTDKNGDDVYIKYQRNGCYVCSMNIQFQGNNIQMLRNTHYKLWDFVMNKLGLAKEIFKFKHGIKEEDWGENTTYMLESYLQAKPCHFDHANWR